MIFRVPPSIFALDIVIPSVSLEYVVANLVKNGIDLFRCMSVYQAMGPCSRDVCTIACATRPFAPSHPFPSRKQC